MTRAQFIEHARDIIEEAIMSAQGIGDWMGETTPLDAARDIAAFVPDIAWSEDER